MFTSNSKGSVSKSYDTKMLLNFVSTIIDFQNKLALSTLHNGKFEEEFL